MILRPNRVHRLLHDLLHSVCVMWECSDFPEQVGEQRDGGIGESLAFPRLRSWMINLENA